MVVRHRELLENTSSDLLREVPPQMALWGPTENDLIPPRELSGASESVSSIKYGYERTFSCRGMGDLFRYCAVRAHYI